MNSINIIGRLTRDIELNHVGQNQTAMINFSIAFSTGYGDNEKSCFVNVQAWQKKAEVISQYFKKGSRIGITGELVQDSWEDKQTGKKQSKLYIKLNDFDFIDSKNNNQSQHHQQKPDINFDSFNH